MSIIRCPECYSKNINQFRQITGAIWCNNCNFRIEAKEKDKRFFLDEIGINIWDDYYDDNDIPDGEIQETFIIVEETLSEEDKGQILSFIINLIFVLFKKQNEPATFKLVYDKFSRNKYKIEIKHLTHVKRLELLQILKKSNSSYFDTKLKFYSES